LVDGRDGRPLTLHLQGVRVALKVVDAKGRRVVGYGVVVSRVDRRETTMRNANWHAQFLEQGGYADPREPPYIWLSPGDYKMKVWLEGVGTVIEDLQVAVGIDDLALEVELK
jgi:hypothetical protein